MSLFDVRRYRCYPCSYCGSESTARVAPFAHGTTCFRSGHTHVEVGWDE